VVQSGGGVMNNMNSMVSRQSDHHNTQKNSNYMNELNTIWQNNGGVGDEIKVQENQWMVGVSKKNKNDKILYDIYVSLSTN